MIRTLCLALLGANLLFFAWSHWLEPGTPVARAAPAPAPVAKALPALPPPEACTSVGPFPDVDSVTQAAAALGAAGRRPQSRTENGQAADGYWVFAGGLEPVSSATVVDGQGEKPVVTDGPYLETKEALGGFWVIDVPDLDVALKLAAEGSKACRGKVEVRPFDGLA